MIEDPRPLDNNQPIGSVCRDLGPSGEISTCTWVGCDSPAKHELGDRNGRQWAHLCDAHNAEMDRAVDSPQVGDIVRAWIKAQGGAKKAAERMMASMERDGFLARMEKLCDDLNRRRRG